MARHEGSQNMSITVKRPVRVKIVVTEQFRTRRAAELRAALAKLELVGKQIGAAALQRGDSDADRAVEERLKTRQRKNEEARGALVRELEKISALDVGEEYDRGVIEGVVEIEVGDSLSKLGYCEIVVEDDVVVEIRDGSCPEVSEM